MAKEGSTFYKVLHTNNANLHILIFRQQEEKIPSNNQDHIWLM